MRANDLLDRIVSHMSESLNRAPLQVITDLCNDGEDLKLKHYQGLATKVLLSSVST